MIEVAQHVIRILRLGKLRLVAWITIRVRQLVIAVRVAILTLNCCMSSGERESRSRMIKCRGTPRGCGVALNAIGAKICLHVVRIGCAVEICTMTIRAARRGVGVLTVLMTLDTLNRLMRACQQKASRAVIESSSLPGTCRVACLAFRRKARGNVIRISCRRVRRLVTRNALCCCRLEHLVPMACEALCCCMRARKRECRHRMVESLAPHK